MRLSEKMRLCFFGSDGDEIIEEAEKYEEAIGRTYNQLMSGLGFTNRKSDLFGLFEEILCEWGVEYKTTEERLDAVEQRLLEMGKKGK